MSAKLERSRDLLADVFGGSHHVSWHRFKAEAFDQASYTFLNDCSTFDGNLLTALVVAAHAYAIRVEIRPAGRYLKLWLSPRVRHGAMHERHPTLADALARMNADIERDRTTVVPTP